MTLETAGETWCADECASPGLVYKNASSRLAHCVETCPASARYVGYNRTCAESCPRYSQSLRCVEACEEGLVLQERACQTRCTDNYVLLDSVCVLTSCPSYFHVLPTGMKECHPNGCPA